MLVENKCLAAGVLIRKVIHTSLFFIILSINTYCMFQVFEKYITEKITLTSAELERMKALCVPKRVRKRQYILQEGDVSYNNCFVARGCMRSYRVGEDGTEHIIRFAPEHWWISDRESYNTGRPAKLNIDALEDSEVLLWTKENYDLISQEIPQVGAFTQSTLAKSFDSAQQRIYENISQTAEEKYESFIKKYPDLYRRVPLHMIASYLGVSRETLSRARSHYAHK